MKTRTVKDDAIKVFLPLIRQRNNYTCGVAALQSILVYYNLYSDAQKELMIHLEADKKVGTEPINIIRFARKQGLLVKPFHGMELDILKTHLNKKRPVMCLLQAWGPSDLYLKGYSGHYVVAVGYDKKYFYFVDPALEGVMGYLECEEFERRWYCNDNIRIYNKYGIVMWKPKFHYCHRVTKID